MREPAAVLFLFCLGFMPACGFGNAPANNAPVPREKHDIDAELRQSVLDQMVVAWEKLDADAMLKLFHPDDRSDAEEIIAVDWRAWKKQPFTCSVSAKPVRKEGDKYYAEFSAHLRVDYKDKGGIETLRLKKDGDIWYLAFDDPPVSAADTSGD